MKPLQASPPEEVLQSQQGLGGGVGRGGDVEQGRMGRRWSPQSCWWVAQVRVLTYWLRAAKQRQFCFSCPIWEQCTQLESETLPNVLHRVLLPRICWVSLLLSPVFIQSGVLPGTLSPPSFLVATGAGLDHPGCVCSRQLPRLCLALQRQWLL